MNVVALRSHLPWILTALLLVNGCAIRREIAISSLALPSNEVAGDSVAAPRQPGKPIRIASYRTRDGLRHEFDGTVLWVGDNLQFRPAAGAGASGKRDQSFNVSAAEVTSVTQLKANPIGVLIAIPIVVVGLGLAIFLALA